MKQRAPAFLVALLLAGGSCGGELNQASEALEVRELVTLEVAQAEGDSLITVGQMARIVVSGALPDACHSYDRALLRREENNLVIQAYATKPLDACPTSLPTPFNDLVIIANLPVGFYRLLDPRHGELLRLAVMPDPATGVACPVATINTVAVAFPEGVPSQSSLALTVTQETPDVCVVAKPPVVSSSTTALTIQNEAFDCREIEPNCFPAAVQTTRQVVVEGLAAGYYSVLAPKVSPSGMILRDFGLITSWPAEECLVNPAHAGVTRLPELAFAGEPLEIKIFGEREASAWLSPLSRQQVGENISYRLAERRCPSAATIGEARIPFGLKDAFPAPSPGEYTFWLNDGQLGKVSVLAACAYQDGDFNAVQIGGEVLRAPGGPLDSGQPVNVLLTAALTNSCASLMSIQSQKSGNEIRVAPLLRQCPAPKCEPLSALYRLVFVLWGLSDGDYTLLAGAQNKLNFRVGASAAADTVDAGTPVH